MIRGRGAGSPGCLRPEEGVEGRYAGRRSPAELTAAARPGWRDPQAWAPPEPAGPRRKEKAGPSGSLPWDTSCSALGPRRSQRLSGSLPAPRPRCAPG